MENKYETLAKLIILKILESLNIVRSADSFYYKLIMHLSSHVTFEKYLICDDENKIFDLLGLDESKLHTCKCEISTYKYFSNSRFYSKGFMNLLSLMRDHDDFKKEIRLLWKTCLNKGYNKTDKLTDEILYVKMIDRFCNSNLEKILLQKAADRIRNRYQGTYISVDNIISWSSYNTVPKALTIREEFYDHISDFYKDHDFPIEQYFTETTQYQTRQDFLSFIQQERLKNLHNST